MERMFDLNAPKTARRLIAGILSLAAATMATAQEVQWHASNWGTSRAATSGAEALVEEIARRSRRRICNPAALWRRAVQVVQPLRQYLNWRFSNYKILRGLGIRLGYVALWMFMDAIIIPLLTLPIIFPAVVQLGFGPQTQGKIERWHQTMKNQVLLENYHLSGELERQIQAFVKYHNNQRYHESPNNVTPADVYFGRDKAIIREREKIRKLTIRQRRLQHRNWRHNQSNKRARASNAQTALMSHFI